MYLKEKEIAEKFKVTKVFLNKCRNQGMPFIRFGSRMIRYDIQEVEQWLKQKTSNKNIES